MLLILSNLLLLSSLTFWVGGMVILAFAVTPSIFTCLSSRNQSGNLVMIIFHRVEVFRFFAIFAILVSEVIKYVFGQPLLSNKELYITCFNGTLFLFLLIGYSFINHRLNSIRALNVSFDNMPIDDPLRNLFRHWHGIMMTSIIISIFLGMSILGLRFVF